MTQPTDETRITSVLQEERVFDPPARFSEAVGGARVRSLEEYRALHRRSLDDLPGFWAEEARELEWFKPWDEVLQGDLPEPKWFVGARTNLCHNAVDRHVAAGHGDEVAIVWEGEPTPDGAPEVRRLTYAELQRETARLASALTTLGVVKGDVVTIYMGMVPELAVALLACARLGAAHSVIFGGFAAQAIADRVEDAGSKLVITCDGGWRRGQVIRLKDTVDEATRLTARIEKVVVVRRTGQEVAWDAARDVWWHDVVPQGDPDFPCAPMDAEDMLFLLYTSGSTGKPKGILHTTAGYMTFVHATCKYVFELRPDAGQLYWCTADIGWVTGHSYVLYGPLLRRVPTLMYEGAPNAPAEDRWWDIVERHRVTHLYTAPTAIRALRGWGDQHVKKHDLSSLALLGTVGEPINPEAWIWYHEVVGGGRCPIVDTWWQTETGGHMITPLPGATPTVPGSCTLPFFGVDAAIVNERGEEMPPNTGGLLAIRRPWPGMLRGIHGDRPRFLKTYFGRIPGMYFAGDGARRDARGYFWIMGRVDDVINVAGHRLGTMEIESALVSHPAVAEAAVVGMPHELKGTGIAAFVSLKRGFDAGAALRSQLVQHVAHEIGALAKPDQVRFTTSLPKTRSGKIMRRLLRDIAAGKEVTQDTTTLEDYGVLAKLREHEEE
ncbi:MAG: acetate--CoA ligase [Planctomycetes bacterium]|nr:acetate--CoA ligase [Planctomycetota bacterium]